MPLQSRQNLYRGVNTHLHSVLQNTPAGWEEFHANHIIDLARVIDAELPSNYRASAERSFQIRASTLERRDTLLRQPEPDIAIYRRTPSTLSSTPLAEVIAPNITFPLIEVFDDPDYYLTAIAIRVVDRQQRGDIVAWIELLSLSNKPPSSGYYEYNARRADALKSGVVFVEIDYLHQQRPVIRLLPPYPAEGSYAYYIALTDPRPNYEKSLVNIYGFAVDDPIPPVRIPLLDAQSVTVDLGVIYNRTFESLRSFSDLVDYEQLPPAFDCYSPNDQERIRARMSAINQA